jgi:Fe-S-cluster containining protein
MNHCGSCTMCCKVLGVKGEVRGVPLKKPRAGWCEHCDIGKGCKVYEDRPEVCSTFECMWLSARKQGIEVPDELRPDRGGVVFAPSTSDNAFSAHMDSYKPDAWKRGAAYEWIKLLVRAGVIVTLDYGDYSELKTILRKYKGKMVAQKVRFTPPDKDGLQWNVVEDEG